VTKDPRVYLAHVLERADRIETYVSDGEAAFMRDTKTQDAVIRNFEAIGEAAWCGFRRAAPATQSERGHLLVRVAEEAIGPDRSPAPYRRCHRNPSPR
jgi:hypothetical protein